MSDRIIDTASGEVVDIPDNGIDDMALVANSPILSAIMSGRIPMFIQKLLQKHPGDPESAEYEYSLFAGSIPQAFDAYINREITVLGCAMLPHDPFVGYADGELREGYVRAFLLIDKKDDDGHNIVLANSGVNVLPAVALAMAGKGWYLWPKPSKYMITRGGPRNAYYLKLVERPSSSKGHKVDPNTSRVSHTE